MTSSTYLSKSFFSKKVSFSPISCSIFNSQLIWIFNMFTNILLQKFFIVHIILQHYDKSNLLYDEDRWGIWYMYKYVQFCILNMTFYMQLIGLFINELQNFFYKCHIPLKWYKRYMSAPLSLKTFVAKLFAIFYY